MDAPLPAALPAGFPVVPPVAFPTALPAGFPTQLPAGVPTQLPAGFPTALPSRSPALPSSFPAVIPVAASPVAPPVTVVVAASPTAAVSVAAPRPTGTSTTTLDCTAVQIKVQNIADTCVLNSLQNILATTTQAQADAVFQTLAKCSCAALLPIKAEFLQFEDQCRIFGQPITDADKADDAKVLGDCEQRNYAAAAYNMELHYVAAGKQWTSSPPPTGLSSGAVAASVKSASTAVGFAGLAAGVFFLA
ncbi:hypothetical protein BDZ88DRAFT_410454 [Geranomyces variabilis]|nr:hypothetical protein BDZ88DRAFT_410454 [Geranomyces variabilis]KAJ3135683.1 hypothetical protein HDU90_003758 [Geranomyces variabilis]